MTGKVHREGFLHHLLEMQKNKLSSKLSFFQVRQEIGKLS